MAEGWRPIFSGNVDGRSVELAQYEPGGELRVRTTQATETQTGFSSEPGSHLLPMTILAGDTIDIPGVDADDLERNLIEDGFTEVGAKSLTRLVRI